MSHRNNFSLTGIWLAGCLAVAGGCTPALSPRISRAVYPGGLTFLAKGSGAYHSLQWQTDNVIKPDPCPLVLHLPDGDLAASDLADPKKLQDRGWQESFQDNGRVTVAYRWQQTENGAEKTLAQVTLVNGTLRTVLVRTTEGVAASVNGKRVPLPIAAGQLDELLGKPLRVDVTDVFQGKIAP